MDAIYARQSVDRKDSISIESQIEFCKHETWGNEYKVYKDKGYSGKNTERPEFQDMLTDIENGLINKVIVYKLDRISRSILDFANMMEIFQRHNVEFVSYTEKFDTSTPMGRAMLNICIVFAQLERETIQKRVADAYYSRSKKGYYMGGRIPYGFSIEKTIINGIKTSKYIPMEAEQEQLRLIYSIYEKPESTLGDVQRFLEANNISHLRGKHWETARLSEMLRNPIYVKADIDIYNFFRNYGADIINDAADFIGTNGCYLYKGESRKNNKTYDLADRHLVIAPHEGFISSDVWLRCRLKCMNNHQSAHIHKGKNSWLIGKVKCAKCGYALIITKAKTQAGRYFNCRSRYTSRRCSGPGTIYASEFEGLILEEIKKKLSEFRDISAQKAKSTNPKIHEYKVKLTQIDTEINSLLAQVPKAGDTLISYINERIEVLDSERRQIQKDMAVLAIKAEGADLKKISADIDMWEKISFEDKKAIVDALIKVIIVDEGNIKITWLI
jgi:site-specific DNA recombinase